MIGYMFSGGNQVKYCNFDVASQTWQEPLQNSGQNVVFWTTADPAFWYKRIRAGNWPPVENPTLTSARIQMESAFENFQIIEELTKKS